MATSSGETTRRGAILRAGKSTHGNSERRLDERRLAHGPSAAATHETQQVEGERSTGSIGKSTHGNRGRRLDERWLAHGPSAAAPATHETQHEVEGERNG